MKWQLQNPDEWHRWFAWRPVRIQHVMHWLVTVERVHLHPLAPEHHAPWWWRYRAIESPTPGAGEE